MGRGVVSSRVTLLLRSAEIKPYWSQRSPSPLQSFTSGCVAMLTLSYYYNIHIFFPPYVLPLQSPSKESSAGDKEFFSGFALLPNLEHFPTLSLELARGESGQIFCRRQEFSLILMNPIGCKVKTISLRCASSDIAPFQLKFFRQCPCKSCYVCLHKTSPSTTQGTP